MNDEIPPVLSVETLSKLLGITPRRIQQLADLEIVERDDKGFYKSSAIAAYISYVKSETRSKPKEIGEKDREQARLYAAQANEKELKVLQLKGELIPVEQFQFVLTSMIRGARTKLLALPTNIAPQLIGVQTMTDAVDILQTAMYAALTDLSEDEHLIDRDDLDSLEGDTAHVCATAQTDSDGMG